MKELKGSDWGWGDGISSDDWEDTAYAGLIESV